MRASNAIGTSEPSGAVTVTTDIGAASAPRELEVRDWGTAWAQLAWCVSTYLWTCVRIDVYGPVHLHMYRHVHRHAHRHVDGHVDGHVYRHVYWLKNMKPQIGMHRSVHRCAWACVQACLRACVQACVQGCT